MTSPTAPLPKTSATPANAIAWLVAIVAAIALTLRKRKLSKYMDPSAQIGVQRKDRMRIVTMASEARQDAKEGGKS